MRRHSGLGPLHRRVLFGHEENGVYRFSQNVALITLAIFYNVSMERVRRRILYLTYYSRWYQPSLTPGGC